VPLHDVVHAYALGPYVLTLKTIENALKYANTRAWNTLVLAHKNKG
jgi:hypothetical protein